MGVRVSSSSPSVLVSKIAQLFEHNLAPRIKVPTLARKYFAEIAQLVEHNLAKVGVAGPSPVFRSTC